MTSELKLPRERMIVFAGLPFPPSRWLTPLRDRQVKAIMGSFHLLHSSPARARETVAFLHTWPTLRLLDSGVFTFLRKTGQLRATVKVKKSDKEVAPPALDDFQQYASNYKEYLKEHLDDWDFVVELDVDNIFGVEVARAFRMELKQIAGDKLIPVWHTVAGMSGWADCYKEFPYVGTGSDKPMDLTFYRRLVDEAHANGAVVHGFGGTRVDVMHAVPYDTADSTTWLAAKRYGQFGGVNFNQTASMSGRQITRARQLGPTLRAMGITPEDLVRTGTYREPLLLAISLLQDREAGLPAIPKPKIQRRLIDL